MARNNLIFIESQRVYDGDNYENDKLNELFSHLRKDSREAERQEENNLLQSML